MATPSPTAFAQIKNTILRKQPAPIYLLHGEEGYYADELLPQFVDLIPESDRDFDLCTFYAPDVDMDTVIDACRRYPMMNPWQVVILKEAQAITPSALNRLSVYASHPSASTILVIALRGQKIGKGAKELLDAVPKAGGTVFEGTKLKDRDAETALLSLIRNKGLRIEPRGLSMLTEYIGTDLSRLYSEVTKLTVALPQGAMITPEAITAHIGVSKEYNNFELVSAVARRDAARAFRIIEYFRSNPKTNFPGVTIATLWNYFSSLMCALFSRDRSDAGICAAMGRSGSWVPPDYKDGMKSYNAWQIIDIMHALRTADCSIKGIGSRADGFDILHQLVYRLLTTTGR